MRIEAGEGLLFIGDSVTDCGRSRPVGTGTHGTLGNGYVAEIDAALTRMRFSSAVEVFNLGVGGNTVRDLANRWDADVLPIKPNWLTILIGINDVWRFFDPRGFGSVAPDEFLRIYDNLVNRVPDSVKRVILMSPFYVQPKRTDPMRARMDEYGAIVKSLAALRGAIFVDLQAALDKELETQPYHSLAVDRVHPTPLGHWVIAGAFLKAVGVTPRPRP
jgi:lysophospholipase L1-like esterase